MRAAGVTFRASFLPSFIPARSLARYSLLDRVSWLHARLMKAAIIVSQSRVNNAIVSLGTDADPIAGNGLSLSPPAALVRVRDCRAESRVRDCPSSASVRRPSVVRRMTRPRRRRGGAASGAITSRVFCPTPALRFSDRGEKTRTYPSWGQPASCLLHKQTDKRYLGRFSRFAA